MELNGALCLFFTALAVGTLAVSRSRIPALRRTPMNPDAGFAVSTNAVSSTPPRMANTRH